MASWLAEVGSLLDVSSVFLFLITVVVFSIPVFIIFPPIPVERSDALGQTHSKIGVSARDSNLRHQWTAHTGTNGHAGGSVGTSQARSPMIDSLHIYPLKSCQGIELAEATVLPTGLEHDRVFCLAQRKTKKQTAAPDATAASETPKSETPFVDVDYWEVITLRQIALMANIKVDLWAPDSSKHSRQLGPITGANGAGSNESFLVVRFPWRSAGVKGFIETVAAKLSRGLSAVAEREFMLPMSFPSLQEAKARGYSHTEVTLFRKVLSALNMGSEVPPELASYLGLEQGKLAVFRLDPAHRRQVFRCAPTRADAGYQPEIDFQDAVSESGFILVLPFLARYSYAAGRVLLTHTPVALVSSIEATHFISSNGLVAGPPDLCLSFALQALLEWTFTCIQSAQKEKV